MKIVTAAIFSMTLLGCSTKELAVQGQGLDVTSTGVGLLLGAAESNPLGLALLGVKAVSYYKITKASPEEQPLMWNAYGALGWGASANNICVITGIVSGGSFLGACPVIGLISGVSAYHNGLDKANKETFALICNKAKQSNPQLTCIPH